MSTAPESLIKTVETHQKQTSENLINQKGELANNIEDVKLKLQDQVTNNKNHFTQEITSLQQQHEKQQKQQPQQQQ